MITREILTEMCNKAKEEKREELEQLKDGLRSGNIRPPQYTEVRTKIETVYKAKFQVLDQLAKMIDRQNTPSLRKLQ